MKIQKYFFLFKHRSKLWWLCHQQIEIRFQHFTQICIFRILFYLGDDIFSIIFREINTKKYKTINFIYIILISNLWAIIHRPLIYLLIFNLLLTMTTYSSNDQLLQLSYLWDVFYLWHTWNTIHDLYLRFITQYFLVIFGNVSDQMLHRYIL